MDFRFIGRTSLGGIICLRCESQLSYLNMEGIDVFVKILAQCKEGQEFRSLEVRGKLIALINHLVSHTNSFLNANLTFLP